MKSTKQFRQFKTMFNGAVIFSLLLFSNAFAADERGHQKNEHHIHGEKQSLPSSEPIKGMSIYQLDSKWTDQHGNTIELGKLKGKEVVLAMAYTSCEYACPILTSRMLQIEQALGEESKDKIRFVLVSIDPKTDTPEKLKQYAKTRGMSDKRWTLLSGSAENVRELAAVLGVNYKKIADGHWAHSNILHLLDSSGVIKKQLRGLNEPMDEFLQAVKTISKTTGNTPKP